MQEFVVDEKSACIDGYPSYGLSVDHFRLNKFASPNDAHFKAIAGELQQLVIEAPQRVALRLASTMRGGNLQARLTSNSDKTSASSASNKNSQKKAALPAMQHSPESTTSPMPVSKLMDWLEAKYGPHPFTAENWYRSPKSVRRLGRRAYRRGDKVGFLRARIATWASGEGTYEPYYVCDVEVNSSHKYACMVAPTLDGVDGQWVDSKELEHFSDGRSGSQCGYPPY